MNEHMRLLIVRHKSRVTVGALCKPPERSGGGFSQVWPYFFRWAD